MSRRSGRTAVGSKRIRMDDPDPSAMDTSGEQDDASANNESFDPMAYYQQQRQEMLRQASQHVQESQDEIARAQSLQNETSTSGGGEDEEGGGGLPKRRSRAAATQAKAALSQLNDDAIDRALDNRPTRQPRGQAIPAEPRTPVAKRQPAAGGAGRRGAGGRARQHATPSVSSYASADDIPRRKAGRPPRVASNVDFLPEDEESLYFIIRNGKASLQQVVDDWIDGYKSDRDKALLALMQFFISASGCRGRMTAKMQQEMEHADIIRIMTEEFDEESGEYPLVSPGIFWKKFKGNFCEFIQLLVKQCQYSIIYDQHLMDNVISLLTQLTDSQVRAFRHTATLASMKLMTALVDVALTVSINLENTQRQYDAEQQNNRSSERLESLMNRRKEWEENSDEIKNMLIYMFKAVFVHRYRDIVPEIRSFCMSEIGVWMRKYPNNFLDDTYLKYIGWTIHDKVGDVRLKCLQTLQPLYSSEELKGKLELFTSKFKDRIIQMTLDIDFDVAVEAVKLTISILKYHPEMLIDKDCESVYELVYHQHRAVAQAAGEFLNEKLFLPMDDQDQDQMRTKTGKKRLPNTPFIRDLVMFFIESELHEHGSYLVDSMIDSNPMMKDWECMTDLLLEDPGPNEEALDDKQETSLIDIMVCCIKQAATGEPPVGRGPTKKVLSAKEQKQVADDKQTLTGHFIQTLPPLLQKYTMDREKIANLLTIPQYFDLEIYSSSRSEKNLDALLKLIREIAMKHSDKSVLESAFVTLSKLCDTKYTIYPKCDVARVNLLDMVANNFREANDEYMHLLAGNEEPNEEEIFKLESSYKKVEACSDSHNMNACDIWESMFTETICKFKEAFLAREELKITLNAVQSAIISCYHLLIWDKHTIENSTERNTTADSVMTLRNRLDKYMEVMKEILITEDMEPFLKEEAYVSICDVLIMFKKKKDTSKNTVLAPLAYVPNQQLYEMLNAFVQNHIFIDEEDEEMDDHAKIEELHKRRNFLACLCKLIVYNVVPTKCAADVFKHYLIFYNDFGDLIKITLSKTRENNKVNCAKAMFRAMSLKFQELLQIQQTSVVNRDSVEFHSLKELAKRFALSFGLDALRNRTAVTELHREGILFSVNPLENPNDPTGPPPNIAFLEITAEFTNKLLKQDKKIVLNYLDKRINQAVPSSTGEDWQPLHVYRNSLMQGELDMATPQAKRPYGRKRQNSGGEEVEEEEENM